MGMLIKNGRVIDPISEKDEISDIFIEKDKIVKVAKNIRNDYIKQEIDAKGCIVAPGFIDMHCHLREPGREDEETIETGMRSAVAGGFTTIMCMPNTDPVIDSGIVAQGIIDEAKAVGIANVIPVGAITKKQKGEELAEIEELKRTGCLAISDDGSCLKDAGLMRKAMEYSRAFGLMVISHCEEMDLTAGGVVNEGISAALSGLKGIPDISETVIVARDIEIARYLDVSVHLAHISCARSVELIRRAKKDGVYVSAETCPHYFSLSDIATKKYDPNTKMNPPLRTEEDVLEIKRGLKDGTLDCIATDHAPHLDVEKELEFDKAAFGIIGFETALGLGIKNLIGPGMLNWSGLISRMSLAPSRILRLFDKGDLSEGKDADIVIIDPEKEWVFKKENIVSKSKNSPFIDWKFKGRVKHTIHSGKVVYSDQTD